MKRTKLINKILSSVLALCMMMSVLPTTVFATEGAKPDDAKVITAIAPPETAEQEIIVGSEDVPTLPTELLATLTTTTWKEAQPTEGENGTTKWQSETTTAEISVAVQWILQDGETFSAEKEKVFTYTATLTENTYTVSTDVILPKFAVNVAVASPAPTQKKEISAFVEPNIIEIANGDTRSESEIIATFPTSVFATVDGVENTDVPITAWALVSGGAFSTSAQGEFYYEPTLAKGYTVLGMANLPNQLVKVGEVTHEPAFADDVVSGGFTVTGDSSNYSYHTSSGILTIYDSGAVTIKNTDINTATSHRIVVVTNTNANITLEGVNIENNNNPPIDIQYNATANITLKDDTTNTLVSANSAALYVPDTTKLIINGDISGTGILNASVVKGVSSSTEDWSHAGIGSNRGEVAGTITINGGVVNATGGASSNGSLRGGAGIGAGSFPSGNNGEITINGGTITATAGGDDVNPTMDIAGIGGGITQTINITGGTVIATSGSDDGVSLQANALTISGGTVTATASGSNGTGLRTNALTISNTMQYATSDSPIGEGATYTQGTGVVQYNFSSSQYAKVIEIPIHAITISNAIENGTVATSPSGTARQGETVTVTATPDSGYVVDAIIVTGVDGTTDIIVTNNTFEMPTQAVTVSASFKTANTLESVAQADVVYGTVVNPTITYTGGSANGNAAVAEYKLTSETDTAYKTDVPTAVGEYTVRVRSTGHATVADKSVTSSFAITQSGTEFVDGIKTFEGNTETTNFNYGNTITVKVIPEATGVAARSLSPNQMALYVRSTNGTDTQITEPQPVTSGTELVFTVQATDEKGFVTKQNTTIVAKYVGNDNMADHEEEVIVSIDPTSWSDYADTTWYDENSSATEFTISTETELAGLAKLVNDGTELFRGKIITLTNDLDLSEHEWVPIGYAAWPSFRGMFDGGGNEITGLYINNPDDSNQGLFGQINHDTSLPLGIKDLGVSGDITALKNVGGVVGVYASNITIINCYYTGTVTGNENVGGIVGENYDGNVTNCYNSGTITGNANVGGIVGFNNSGTVTNSYWKEGTASSGIGTNGGTETNVTSFDDDGNLSDSVGINGWNHSKLLNALNAGTEAHNLEATSEIVVDYWETGAEYPVHGLKGILPSDITYNGNIFYGEAIPKATVSAEYGEITFSYYDYTQNGETITPKDAGVYDVELGVETATHKGVKYTTLTISQSGTDFNGGVKTYKSGESGISTEFTYGDIITVKVTPEATGVAPITTFSLTPPQAKQMALFIGNTQITEAQAVISGQELTFTINTVDKDLDIGVNAITAKYMGDDNMAYYEETVDITLNKLSLTATVAPNQSKGYDGDNEFNDVPLVLTNKISNDDVTATADGTASDKNSGNNKMFTPTDVALSGDNVGYYTLNTSDVSGTVTISKANSLIATAPTAKTLKYTGLPQELVNSGTATGGEIQYSLTENDTYSTTIPAGTSVDTYTVYYKVVGDDNHNDTAVASVNVTIDKADSSAIIAPTAKTLKYTGLPQEFVNSGTATGGEMQYSLMENGEYSAIIPTGTSADTYTVYYKVVGDDNHNDTAVASVNVTIDKADSSAITAPTAKTLKYTGLPQELVNSGTATGGEIQYSLTEDGEYSTTIPTGTSADTYTVYYKVVGDDNHNDTAVASVNVTIGKATPTLSITDIIRTYSGSVVENPTADEMDIQMASYKDITFTYYEDVNGSKGTKLDTAPTNAGTYWVVASIAESNNYNLAVSNDKQFTIDQTGYLDAITATGTAKYGTSGFVDLSVWANLLGANLGAPTVISGANILEANSYKIENDTLVFKVVPDAAVSDDPAIITIPVSSTNYGPFNITVTVTASDKNVPIISVENITKIYDSEQVTNLQIDGTAIYDGQPVDGEWIFTGAPTIANVSDTGVYTVVFTPTESDIYATVESQIQVTISKRTVTITANNKSAYVGDSKPVLGDNDYTVSGLVDGENLHGDVILSYENTPNMGQSGTVKIIASGVSAPDSGNYNDIVYVDGTLTISNRPTSGSTSATKYDVDVTFGSGDGSYEAGTWITIKAENRTGYTFSHWASNEVTFENAKAETTRFIMNNKNVEVTAVYVLNDGVITPEKGDVKPEETAKPEDNKEETAPVETVKPVETEQPALGGDSENEPASADGENSMLPIIGVGAVIIAIAGFVIIRKGKSE